MSKELTTLFTGRHLTSLTTVNSTSSYLAEILKSQLLPEGAAIRASEQKAGRGQLGTRWSSEAGKNLLVSFVFYPSFISSRRIFSLNRVFSLGVYDFVKSYLGNTVRIKWPNDIYAGDKKVAGMLIENLLNSSGIQHSILGVGININQHNFSLDIPNPVSFFQVRPDEYDLDDLFVSLCSHVEMRYLQLKRGDSTTLDQDYTNALYRFGDWSWFEDEIGKFSGSIVNVNEDGQLMIEHKEGKVVLYDFKQIRFVI